MKQHKYSEQITLAIFLDQMKNTLCRIIPEGISKNQLVTLDFCTINSWSCFKAYRTLLADISRPIWSCSLYSQQSDIYLILVWLVSSD